jgi:hypothetical protein
MRVSKLAVATGLAIGVVMGLVFVVPSGGRAVAQARVETPAGQQQLTPTQAQTTRPSSATYSYTAQPGDSYSLMARKAVQTYGKKYKVNLSGAKILFAEAHLALAAGMPYLDLDQKVEMPESLVKQWVDSAQKLSPTEEAAWNYYTQFVDFNTNRVGQK